MENYFKELNDLISRNLVSKIESSLKVGWTCGVEIYLEIPLEIKSNYQIMSKLEQVLRY